MKSTALPAYTLLVVGWIGCFLVGGVFEGAGAGCSACHTVRYKSTKWAGKTSNNKALNHYRVPVNTILICESGSYISQPGFMLTAGE